MERMGNIMRRKMERCEIRFGIPKEDYEILREYAVAESPGDSFGTVIRGLMRDGLRFRSYIGGALERLMIIGVTDVSPEDDIQSLARCALERIKGK